MENIHDLTDAREEIAEAKNALLGAAPVITDLDYITSPEARRENNRIARRRAERDHRTEFTGECGKHGAGLFDTVIGACLLCIHGAEQQPPSVRLPYYRMIHAVRYERDCPTHGRTWFNVQNNACILCHSLKQGNPARVMARRERRKTYSAPCDACGTSEHYVTNGKCATCFTTVGARREGRTVDPARVAARNAGRKTYPGVCGTCGPVAFYVNPGKCSRCFTAMGWERKRPA